MSTSQPSISILAPLGANPWKLPGPAKVPLARQRTATRVREAVVSITSSRKSGNAANKPSKYSRTPSGAITSSWPTNRSTPPGAQQATISSTSRSATAWK